HNTIKRPMLTSKYGDDALPGGNHAILTLADGSSVRLDSLATGSRLSHQGTAIRKTAEGQITYEKSDGEASAGLNKVITPPGGEFQIILPDSTTVWMNAGSELSYPTTFTGNERRVQLIGEAY